jgi:hypothetical protein
MTRRNRLDKVEARLSPEAPRVVFQMCHETCTAYRTMTHETHIAWHRERGEFPFTLNLGAAAIAGASDAA